MRENLPLLVCTNWEYFKTFFPVIAEILPCLGNKNTAFSWDFIFIILQQPSFGDEQRLPEKSRVANSVRLRQRLLTAENPRHRLKWMWWVCLISLNIYIYIYINITLYTVYNHIHYMCMLPPIPMDQRIWSTWFGPYIPHSNWFFRTFSTLILNLDKSWWAPRSCNLGCSPMWQVYSQVDNLSSNVVKGC